MYHSNGIKDLFVTLLLGIALLYLLVVTPLLALAALAVFVAGALVEAVVRGIGAEQ